MASRTFDGRARALASATAMLLIGAIFVAANAEARVQSRTGPLGPKQTAKGTAVKIGFITDDTTASTDNSIETPVANAAVQWINRYRNGVGGHPIELDRCVTNGDPGKSADCANQLIADEVAAVVTGSNQQFQSSWIPLHDAGIPVFTFATGFPDALQDPDSTFVFSAGQNGLMNMMISAAKKHKAKKVSVVAIDVPPATQFYEDQAPALFEKAGLGMELIPIALGTADMTPQMQRVVSDNPKGVVFVIGNDSFCIAAFNGLRTANFQGPITTIPQCLSDATRTAVPADFLDGMQISATVPLDNPKDPSIKQYYAVLDKFGASSVDKTRSTGVGIFQSLAGLNVATQNLKGEATPESITAAARSMPWTVLPATGGLHVRCSGKADPTQPGVCNRASLTATLGPDGKAVEYTAVGDTEIPA